MMTTRPAYRKKKAPLGREDRSRKKGSGTDSRKTDDSENPTEEGGVVDEGAAEPSEEESMLGVVLVRRGLLIRDWGYPP